VIGNNGKQLGIMGLSEALKTANDQHLDLIQITDKVTPPVCKIMEYGKYLYQLGKKEKHQGKKTGEVKNIRLNFNISPHDMETKAIQAEKFLKKGDKVRIEMYLRGRQKGLKNFARDKFNQFIQMMKTKTPIKIDQDVKMEMGRFTAVIVKA